MRQLAAHHVVTLSHDADESTRAAIQDWIDEDPGHAVAFAQAEAAWEAAERLKHAASASAAAAAHAAPSSRFRPTGWLPARAALSRRQAVAAGVVAAGGLAFGATRWLDAPERYATNVGEVRDVRLPDGSTLHLNTNSEVKVQYTAARRLLTLVRGEAYFEVAHAPRRPFDVQVEGAVVRALGTAFNVRIRDALVELTVTKGVVGVRGRTAGMRQVPAGESAVIQPRAIALSRLDAQRIDQRVAWRDRTIELNGESVFQAVDEFNRYRAQPMVIGDPRVAPLRVGGRFRVDESALFLHALEESLPVRSVANPDGTILLLYRDEAS